VPLDCELFLNIPPGFTVHNNKLIFSGSFTKGINKDGALKLKKNMYGLKQARNNWFHCLKQSLIDRGFTRSSIDPCFFIHKNCIIIVYVDDCLIFPKTDNILDSVVQSLQVISILPLKVTSGPFWALILFGIKITFSPSLNQVLPRKSYLLVV
jgi:hypothetical protein